MESPTLKGLNSIIKTPPAKFDSEPCKDKPTAKPTAPRMATNEEVSIPSLEIKVMKSKKRIAQSKLSAKKADNVGSNSRLTIILLTKRLISRIA